MKQLSALFVALVMLSPTVALAQISGYIGGSLGASFYNTKLEDVTGKDFDLDDTGFAWKVFGGIRANEFIGLEGGYRDFGKVQNVVANTDLESKATGWDLYATGTIPVGPLKAFAKAGVVWWRADAKIDEDPFEVTGTDFTWGLGAAFILGGLGVRADVERFELGNDESMMMLTAGVTLFN